MAYFTDTGNGVIADDGTLITYSDAVMRLNVVNTTKNS